MKRATLAAASLVLVLAACGGDDGGAATTDAPAGVAATAGAETTATPDAGAPAVGTAPTEAPDPCTLLTADEAFALLTPLTKEEYVQQVPGAADFAASPGEMDGKPSCEYGNGSVELSVSVIPAEADTLESYHQALLDNWTGETLAGVGDGAELGGATPVGLQAFEGFWQIDLRAYVAQLGPDEGYPDRFATAANLVFERLASG